MQSFQSTTNHVSSRYSLPLLFLAIFVTNLMADDALIAKQFVNATTIVVAKIDSTRISLPEALTKKIANVKELQYGAKSVGNALQEIIVALNGESVYVVVDVPFTAAQSPVRLFVKNAPGLDAKKLFEHFERLQFAKPVVQGDFLCLSMFRSTESSDKVAIAEDVLTLARPDLPVAMQAIQEFPIQVFVLPPEYLWATFRDLMPTIPTQFGGGPTSLLTEGVRWSAIGIDPAKLQLQSVTQSQSPGAAKALASHLPQLLSASASQLRFPLALAGVGHLIPFAKPVVREDQVIVSIDGLPEFDGTVELIGGLISQLFATMTTQVKMDRFKQLTLAIHNFESANRVFPPAKEGRDSDGNSNLSWRVHILPYIGQTELYFQFHLKEAWNSEHNLKLLDKMPDIYKGVASGLDSFSELKPGYTTFQAPVGDGTIFGGTKPVKISDINDGTSNTICLVEVKAEFAKPWTAPEDYRFDIANPAMGLAEIASEKPSFLGALADGSVSKFPLSMPAKSLQHLFQMNDGNVVSW